MLKTEMIDDRFEYWEDFGYRIAGPVVYAFSNWIRKTVNADATISDVLFVARDGYLPFKVCQVMGFDRSVGIHYVYAPRSIRLSNDDEELSEYKQYISDMNFGRGRLAIVDTITDRFSAQTLLGDMTGKNTLGLYWSITSNAIAKAKKEKLKYKEFKPAHENSVLCWNLVEFILSAPEHPVKSIQNGKPVYYIGNSYESRRIEQFDYIVQGVFRFVNSGEEDSFLRYSDVYHLLNSLYEHPGDKDVKYLSEVRVSTFPDHSDDIPVLLYREQRNKQNDLTSLIARLKAKARNKSYYYLLSQVKRKIHMVMTKRFEYRGGAQKLAKKLERYNVISFDIFDTLVLRNCSEPTQIFQRLESKNGLFDFFHTRTEAEKETILFRAEDNGEINIFEIYETLGHYYGNKITEQYIEDEIEEEIAACYANPYMKEVFDLLRRKNKKLIAVSNMYWPENYLRRILYSCGYDGFLGIYSSCDYRLNKRRGELQKLVSAQLEENSIVHIGDSFESDFLGSRVAGWDAIFISQKRYRRFNKQRRND